MPITDVAAPVAAAAPEKLNLAKTQVLQAGASLPEKTAVSPTPPSRPSETILCLTCNASNPATSRFCRECGTVLVSPNIATASNEAEPNIPRVESGPKGQATPARVNASPLLEDLVSTAVSAQPSKGPRAAEKDRQLDNEGNLDEVTPGGTLTSAQDNGPVPSLGTSLRPGSKICASCGASSSSFARFCQICGDLLDGVAEESPVVVVKPSLPKAELVVIAQDGTPGKRYRIDKESFIIGKGGQTDIALDKDPYVSDSHARLTLQDGQYLIEDLASINGVFFRIRDNIELKNADRILIGLAVLQFEIIADNERNIAPRMIDGVRLFGTPPTPRFARLKLETVEEIPRDLYYLARTDTVLGREAGEIVFTSDPFMSRRHAAIRRDPNTNRFTLRDLGSSNGTFVAIRRSQSLNPGDHIRIGQHLFRLDVEGSTSL